MHRKEEDTNLVDKLKEDLDRYMRSYGYNVQVSENSTTYLIGNSRLILTELTQAGISFNASVNGYHPILTEFERAYRKARKKTEQ